MQASLTSIFSLEIDPREAALRETEDAIGLVLTSAEPVELSPQNAYIRRLQHQMAERANLVSRSRGREPYRRVAAVSGRGAERLALTICSRSFRRTTGRRRRALLVARVAHAPWVRSLPCSLAPSPAPPCGTQGKTNSGRGHGRLASHDLRAFRTILSSAGR